MNKVHCWFPKLPNVGHASMEISFGAGIGKFEYVSWWPKGVGSKGTPGAKPLKPAERFDAAIQTFDNDVKAEGRFPDRTVVIDCLDENRMRMRFRDIMRDPKYNMTIKNCATTVADILMAGGAVLSIDCMNFAKRVVWTPAEVSNFALLINAESRVIKAGISKGFKPALQWVTPTFNRAW